MMQNHGLSVSPAKSPVTLLCRRIMDTGCAARTYTDACRRRWLSTFKDCYKTMASKISQKDGYQTVQD